jgi:hypothetical protein
VRSVDLAVYADALVGEASSLAARIERERGRARLETIERAARLALPAAAVERLSELGLLGTRADSEALAALEESLDALEVLQAWVEEQLGPAAVSRGAA